MHRIGTWLAAGLALPALEHVARTTVVATASLLLAGVMGLPEVYWAAITSMIVMQSTLGQARTISMQRLVGSALGAVMGGFGVAWFGANPLAFAVGILLVGLVCAVAHLDRAAYRFAGITLAVVMLVARDQPSWVVSLHRFVEESTGIAVALVITALWPEREVEGAS